MTKYAVECLQCSVCRCRLHLALQLTGSTPGSGLPMQKHIKHRIGVATMHATTRGEMR